MQWSIAKGGMEGKNTMAPKKRLYTFVCRSDLVDEISRMEIYNFIKTIVNTDFTVQEFHKFILSYTYVILCREKNDGSLRGINFIGVDRKRKENGKPYTVMRIGFMYFQPEYRGGPFLYNFGIYIFLRESLTHPLTPLYVVGKSFSCQSYLIMNNCVKHTYPRYDEETPELVRDIINNYGLQAKAPNETYNKDTFVLERVRNNLKKTVVDINDSALKNPHINFYIERNPYWKEGHQLIILGCVQWWDVLGMAIIIITRVFGGKMKKCKVEQEKN